MPGCSPPDLPLLGKRPLARIGDLHHAGVGRVVHAEGLALGRLAVVEEEDHVLTRLAYHVPGSQHQAVLRHDHAAAGRVADPHADRTRQHLGRDLLDLGLHRLEFLDGLRRQVARGWLDLRLRFRLWIGLRFRLGFGLRIWLCLRFGVRFRFRLWLRLDVRFCLRRRGRLRLSRRLGRKQQWRRHNNGHQHNEQQRSRGTQRPARAHHTNPSDGGY